MYIEKLSKANYTKYIIEPATHEEEKFIDSLITAYRAFNQSYYPLNAATACCKQDHSYGSDQFQL